MHILHGTWISDAREFAFWGEDTGREPNPLKGRRGKTAPHTFCLNFDELLSYVQRFTTDSQPWRETVLYWLPGYRKAIQPSPEAQAAGMEALNDPLQLLLWRVDAIFLAPSEFLDFILQLPNESRGFVLGSDLAYWQQVGLLIMNYLVEGRYIPALEPNGNSYLARWQVHPDENQFRQLQANMPPLCRAIAPELSAAPQPADLLRDCMNSCINAFIGEQYQERRLYKAIPWLQALTQPYIIEPLSIERRFYETWQKWQSLEGVGAGNYRVCLRLEEPSVGRNTWQLSYLLQANDDPSLLVEAGKVWGSKGKQLDYLAYRFDNPQERLLRALGLASRIFPPIENSLREAKPTGMTLDTNEAYHFLTEAAAPLESSGFGVLIPNWWGKRARLKAKASIKAQTTTTGGILTRDSLLRYQWEASLNGDPISEAEFEQLVALKQPIVRYRGEWLSLDPDQINAMLKFFNQAAASEREISLLDAFKLATDEQAQTPEGVEVEGVQVEDWLEDLFGKLGNPQAAEMIAPPPNLKATLRPYQARGVGWLSQMEQMKLGACLADDMGLGKSIMSIAYWLKIKPERPALLVCPTSLVGNWAHEIARFAPSLRYMKHQGASRLSDEAFVRAAQDANIVLTSYALVHRDIETLQQVAWSSVVLDEAQNIKNPATKQAQAVRSLPADHKIALTGTPVENRLTELWSIFQFLNPGYLGSEKAFRANFALPIERYADQEQAASLKKLTAPFILRRLKTDPNVIQDLPEKFENKVYCSLTAEQATLYEATVREEMETIEAATENIQRSGGVLRMLTHLKQICNHPAHFLNEGVAAQMTDRSGKLARLVEMLEEVRELGERALIFTQYAEMGTLLQDYLRAVFVDEALFLHGGTPPPKRDEMVRRFQSENGPPLFILSLKAGGTGLNLTQANHVFHFDRWYNPAVENQATDRAFRIGQTKNVQVHKFICLGTLEERIDEMIEHKQALADQIIGEGENWIAQLDNDGLRDLVMLRREVMEV